MSAAPSRGVRRRDPADSARTIARALLPAGAARRALAAALAAVTLGACRAVTSTEERGNPLACQQTYEFGNYGCARLVALVEGPPAPWPASYRFDVRAVPVSPAAGASTVFATAPGVPRR